MWLCIFEGNNRELPLYSFSIIHGKEVAIHLLLWKKQGITHSFWIESSPCSKSQFDRPVHTSKSPSRAAAAAAAASIPSLSPGFPESYCDADLNSCFPDPYSWNSATNRGSCSIGASTDHSTTNQKLEFALGTNSTCAMIRSHPKRSNPPLPHTS